VDTECQQGRKTGSYPWVLPSLGTAWLSLHFWEGEHLGRSRDRFWVLLPALGDTQCGAPQHSTVPSITAPVSGGTLVSRGGLLQPSSGL
jgi:hypothetical protein